MSILQLFAPAATVPEFAPELEYAPRLAGDTAAAWHELAAAVHVVVKTDVPIGSVTSCMAEAAYMAVARAEAFNSGEPFDFDAARRKRCIQRFAAVLNGVDFNF
jgi:hypothetical protein